MRRSSLFGHVAELLEEILSSTRPADLLSREFFRSRHYLGARDRRFIAEETFGILRDFAKLDFLAQSAFREACPTPTPAPSIALCAAYALHVKGERQETLLPDIEATWRSAAVEPSPDAFLALLARARLPAEILGDPLQRMAIEYSLPKVIVQEWIRRWGVVEAEALCRAQNHPAPTAIRVNTIRCNVPECRDALAAEGVPSRPALLAPDGLLLEKRVNVQSLQAFRRGYFEIQDEGSQLISLLVGARPGARIVDACAGAGGKTLHLAALMGNTGTLLALDAEPERLAKLPARAHRAGATMILRSEDPLRDSASWRGKADAVLVDAPCSGVGTFRRNPGAKILFSSESLPSFTARQSEILERAAALVRPGGRLVYSTCSLLEEENEQVVERFLASHAEFSFSSAAAILQSEGVPFPDKGPYLRLFPHRHGTDGFFAAVMAHT